MKASEDLKHKILNQIDALDDSILEEFYGLLTNFINSKRDINDWDLLTDIEKQGIIDAISEVDEGKGIPHKQVMSNIRQKYSDA